MKERKRLFSNGTEFMLWQSRNCDICVKASRYNPKTDTYTKYRCAVQRDIEDAAIGDGCGNERVYNATHSCECPYLQTDRKVYRKRKTRRTLEGQTTIKFDEQ